jgi:hypothetical protein
MKKVIEILLCAAITFGFIYLLGAFYSATFDIRYWSEGARFGVTFIGSMFSFILPAAYTLNKYDK